MAAVIEPRPAPQVIHGSCRCGDVGFRISGQPLRLVTCQCENCRHARSAACASNLFVPVRQFRWTRGESQVVSYRLPGPTAFATAFCRRCGGDLPRASSRASVVVVPVGTVEGAPGAGVPGEADGAPFGSKASPGDARPAIR
jgi:hypothetical protein